MRRSVFQGEALPGTVADIAQVRVSSSWLVIGAIILTLLVMLPVRAQEEAQPVTEGELPPAEEQIRAEPPPGATATPVATATALPSPAATATASPTPPRACSRPGPWAPDFAITPPAAGLDPRLAAFIGILEGVLGQRYPAVYHQGRRGENRCDQCNGGKCDGRLGAPRGRGPRRGYHLVPGHNSKLDLHHKRGRAEHLGAARRRRARARNRNPHALCY